MTEPKKRGRPTKTPANSPASWPVGKFTASIEDGWYTLRAGPALVLRTDCEENFKEYCALIEAAG